MRKTRHGSVQGEPDGEESAQKGKRVEPGAIT